MAVAIKDIIPHILEKQADWRVALARDWHKIVGSLGTRTCLEKIFEDTAIIGVYESHWMQELYLLSSDIRDLLNSMLPTPRIKHVRFKLVEERKKRARILPMKKRKRQSVVPLSGLQKEALERIKDQDLQSALTDFWARCTVFQEHGS